MADGHPAHRDAGPWPVTKLFSSFRIALDPKKLVLAGAGIFAAYLGWWLLCCVFYTSSAPQWKDYDSGSRTQKDWDAFKRDRRRWNLLHELAGPPTSDPASVVRVDAGDVARSPEELADFDGVIEGRKMVSLDVANKKLVLDGRTSFDFDVVNPNANDKEKAALIDRLKAVEPMPFSTVVVHDDSTATIAGQTIKIASDFDKLKALRSGVRPLSALSTASRDLFQKHLASPRAKPAGKFRVCPWNEDRGPNPFLSTMDVVHGRASFGRGGFFTWLIHDQLPVLLEPLVKFIAPIFYLFKPDAGGWRNTPFLLLVAVWNLAVWGYFGGAICRLAAVEFARNEKIPLSEAIAFVNQRAKQFILAPLFPLGLLAGLAFVLAAMGFVTGWTYFFGDIVIAGLLWPVTIVLGLVMGVLLVGLFAWPLMYPTIAVEGSDSFDALSRSYSYLYQAPWQLLGYAASALLYGAAVVFFVGFMASLTVYLGKWGFGQAPGLGADEPKSDRTPVYLFQHAPKSFGWRDLLLQDSPWVTETGVSSADGAAAPHLELRKEYLDEISIANSIGGWLVTFWLSVVLLMVIGFGYTYFWTASTILYFLMRKTVDDTNFDEIHLDEEDAPPPPPPSPPPAKPGTVSLSVVDPPKN